MLDERTIDLIQRSLDGEIDAEECLELNLRLERDDAAKVVFQEMLSVVAFLDSTPPNEVPAGFAPAVMKGIQGRSAASVVRPFFRVQKRMATRLALGLAAAAAIAFVLTPSLFQSLDPAQLRGTMVAPAATTERSWTVSAGPQAIYVTTTATHVSLQFAGSKEQLAADVVFDPAVLQPQSPGGATRPAAEGGVIVLTLRNAPTVVRFIRNSRKAADLSVHLRQPDGAQLQARIEIPELNQP